MELKSFLSKLFFALFIVISVESAAQKFDVKFNHISIGQGLSQSIVQSIYQDKMGFLWFGTQDGLNRYDGYKFKIFRPELGNPNSIPNNIIGATVEDQFENLWIGTLGGGLCKYDKRHGIFTNYSFIAGSNSSLPSNQVQTILFDSKGRFWLGTTGGLCLMDTAKGTFHVFTTNPSALGSMPNLTINNIFEDSEHKIWISTNGMGVAVYNELKKEFEYFRFNPLDSESLTNDFVGNIVESDDNKYIWIGTANGLNLLNKKTKKIKRFYQSINNPDSLSDSNLTYLYKDLEGEIWIGTNSGGLNRIVETKINGQLSDFKFQKFQLDMSDNKGIDGNTIWCIFEDRTGVLWVSTNIGLNKIDKKQKKFHHVAPKANSNKALSDATVFCFEEDKDGNLYVGTQLGGLNILKSGETDFIHLQNNPNDPNSLPPGSIRAIHVDKYNDIWVGFAGIVSKLTPNGKKGYKIKNYFNNPNIPGSVPGARISQIIEDSEGVLWFATFGAGLVSFNREQERFSSFRVNRNEPGSLLVNGIRAIIEDKDRNLLLATQGGGVSVLRKENRQNLFFENYTHIENDSSSINVNIVFSVFEDSKGRVWVGTYGGGLALFNLKTGKFKSYTTKNGLPNDVIYGIEEDAGGNLWLSTNVGLAKFNPETEAIQKFDVNDGLQSNEFNAGSYYKSKNGRIYFGGVNGYTSFFPDEIKSNPFSPQVVITDFQIFNKSVVPGKNSVLKKEIAYENDITLNYSDYTFSIEFAGLQYVTTDKNQYAIKLENFDSDWLTIGSRRYVTYVNIPPGEYIFKVKAANSDGVWNENYTSLKITITPPFWKTKWFIALEIIFLISAIFLFIHFRTKKLLYDKHVLEAKVKERTIEILSKNEELQIQNEQILQQKEEILAQRDEIEQQMQVVTNQRDQIVKQNKSITDSIHYAGRIQNALLPPEESIVKNFPEHFILYMPKDIVSGDFYWIKEVDDILIIAVADCTGHGVPGAFMSMLGIALLNEMVNKKEIVQPAQALNELRNQIKSSLHQKGIDGEAKDGMDIALCTINMKTWQLNYAGANNPLLLLRSAQKPLKNALPYLSQRIKHNDFHVVELKADKMPIGIHIVEKESFTNHSINLEVDDTIYLFSDGYQDQFGGNYKRKFLSKNFKELLLKIQHLTMKEQANSLKINIENWKGRDNEQIDDILVLGVKITQKMQGVD